MRHLYFAFVVAAIGLVACNRKADKPDNVIKPVDTLSQEAIIKDLPTLKVSYQTLELNDSLYEALDKTFDSLQLEIILALNRIDRHKLRASDTLVVPDTFVTDLKSYSPFPIYLSMLDSVKKILLCSYPIEAFAAYEYGRLVRWGPTSMGKRTTPTPIGLFHTNWKAKRTISTVNEEWTLDWYFNLTNFGGASFHVYELPGYPASHSCVRLKVDDAKWIYYWAEQWKLTPDGKTLLAHGTPVVIFGSYDFDERKPWLKLANSADSFRATEEELNTVLQSYMPTIIHEQLQRDSVLNELSITNAATVTTQVKQ